MTRPLHPGSVAWHPVVLSSVPRQTLTRHGSLWAPLGISASWWSHCSRSRQRSPPSLLSSQAWAQTSSSGSLSSMRMTSGLCLPQLPAPCFAICFTRVLPHQGGQECAWCSLGHPPACSPTQPQHVSGTSQAPSSGNLPSCWMSLPLPRKWNWPGHCSQKFCPHRRCHQPDSVPQKPHLPHCHSALGPCSASGADP